MRIGLRGGLTARVEEVNAMIVAIKVASLENCILTIGS